ncbi:MAG: phosphate ABC transporter ATP-binding protein [Anaerolineales bacterium]|nr:phosphate ABC transporter ATP-binding protein [Anaerolineales bacterium]
MRGVQQTYTAPGAPPRRVLDVDALDVPAGALLAVVGPSGAGKSTLLRLLNFLEPPSAGALFFAGRPVPAAPPLSLVRRVTTVFQRPVMLTGSVWDNVAYGLRLRGLPAEPAVSAALERVGLAGLARQPAVRLSGGEAQRVALARALVLQPEVLLLDEPTANLDPYNVGVIEDLVRADQVERGTTVVLVTHNVFQARRMAGHAALLLGGRLIETGPAPQFFGRPADPRTAAFVRGEMVY